MRFLVLGGTWFLGRTVVEEALKRGHHITTFNRGISGPDVDGAESIHGDREKRADLVALARGRTWDAVIDTSGYVPRVVHESAAVLADRAGSYSFVSSVSVYRGWPLEPLTDDSEVLECPADAGPDYGRDDLRGYPTQYGFQKAGCERAVNEFFGARSVVLRPGVILGAYEYVGRLPWWLRRIARGGRVLSPGRSDRSIQPIDARDVAAFILKGLESGLSGTFNTAAPKDHATFGSVLDDCIAVTSSDAELTWIDDAFLVQHGAREWTELPLWRTHAGTWDVAAGRAEAAGLRCRPLRETVRDTWVWMRERDDRAFRDRGVNAVGTVQDGQRGADLEKTRESQHGISPEKERQILRAWDAAHETDPVGNQVEGPGG